MKKSPFILSAVIAFSALTPAVPAYMPASVYAADADETVSGKFGDNVSWQFTPDKRLIISGEGDIQDAMSVPAGWYDFRDDIQTIIIEEGITSVGVMCFYQLPNVSSVSLPSTLTSIGECAFTFCTNLKTVNIPDNVVSIDASAFDQCAVESLSLPDGIKTIGRFAFRGCQLTAVDIPDSVTSLGQGAFFSNSRLEEVNVPDTLTAMNYAFGKSAITSITIPEHIEYISEMEFLECNDLTEVKIPYGAKSIKFNAFRGCGSLTSVDIPDTVTSIGSDAFVDCTALENITIPFSVRAIGYKSDKNSVFPESCTIRGYSGSAAESYAKEWGLKFIALNNGDVNSDGKCTVADLIILQKWLLNDPDAGLNDRFAADLNANGRVDVFDFILMRDLAAGV